MMKSESGSFVATLGHIIFTIAGFWSFILDLGILYAYGGSGLVIVGFFAGPITIIGVPLYAAFVWGYWDPLIIGAVGGIVGRTLINYGDAFDAKFADTYVVQDATYNNQCHDGEPSWVKIVSDAKLHACDAKSNTKRQVDNVDDAYEKVFDAKLGRYV